MYEAKTITVQLLLGVAHLHAVLVLYRGHSTLLRKNLSKHVTLDQNCDWSVSVFSIDLSLRGPSC